MIFQLDYFSLEKLHIRISRCFFLLLGYNRFLHVLNVLCVKCIAYYSYAQCIGDLYSILCNRQDNSNLGSSLTIRYTTTHWLRRLWLLLLILSICISYPYCTGKFSLFNFTIFAYKQEKQTRTIMAFRQYCQKQANKNQFKLGETIVIGVRSNCNWNHSHEKRK